MDQFIQRQFPPLISLLYDAAVDPGRWPAFLDAAAEPLGGACGIFRQCDNRLDATPTHFTFGMDRSFLASDIGKLLRATHPLEEENANRAEPVNNFMQLQEIGPRHIGVVLQKDGNGMAVFAVCPRAGNLRSNLNKYGQRLQLLAPHMIRAVEMNQITARARFAECGLANMLHAFAAAAFLLDGSGRVIAANSRGEHLMRVSDVLTVDPFGGLRVASRQDSGVLEAARRRAANANSAPVQGPLRLVAPGRRRTFFAWIVGSRDNTTMGSTLLLLTPATSGWMCQLRRSWVHSA
jgi:hypothetical protein